VSRLFGRLGCRRDLDPERPRRRCRRRANRSVRPLARGQHTAPTPTHTAHGTASPTP